MFTASGALALKHGFSPYAKSAYAAVPTGTPRSPLFGAQKFTQPLNRVRTQTPLAMTRDAAGNALFPTSLGERPAKRLSYHNDFSANRTDPRYINPLSKRGPIEGRPPGEFFAHQRWDEFFPKVGYVSSLAPVADGSAFHPAFPAQQPNSVWTWGEGKSGRGIATPFMIKARYGEPVMFRAYNNLPLLRTENNGFGRNETQLHFHNAHNGAESDGAANVHHFPGTFYDYRWSTALARQDMINTGATDRRASAPNGSGGLNLVPGDWRELQGTMWCHDHRFFFTAENVYKGNLGLINLYSGRDRGNEVLNDGVNLRLPSGSALDWENVDFDVNLLLTDAAFLLEINALDHSADPTPARSVSGSDFLPIPETGEHLFGKLCAPCHTIGVGPRVGPDLLDVSGRRSAEWLAAFIKKPSDFHMRHDPMAEELAQDFPNVRMPDLRLGDADVADLIIYVDSVSRRVNGIVASADAGAGEAAHHETHNHQN